MEKEHTQPDSHQSVFSGSLPSPDRFGGTKTVYEAHAAVLAYCAADERNAALLYLEDRSVEEIATMLEVSVDRVPDLILGAEYHILRAHTRHRGASAVRAARAPRVHQKAAPVSQELASIVTQSNDGVAIDDLNWRDEAACRDANPVLFDVADKTTPRGAAETVEMYCSRCRAEAACLMFALNNNIEFGLYGGMVPLQRRELLRKNKGRTT